MNIQKKLIIKEGTYATYDGTIPVILCDVKSDDKGTYFRARDRRTNELLRKQDGRPIEWSAQFAIQAGTIVIDNPEYVEVTSRNGVTIVVDPLKERRDELRKFFANHVKFDDAAFVMDDEQLNAILSEKNTLVTARAGSGKTRVLVGKVIYLFEKQGMDVNNVLAFCFNRDAREEINTRLQTKCKIDGVLKYAPCEVANTFHAFARRTLGRPKILMETSRLIKDAINELKTSKPNFSKSVYEFFRKETLKIDRKSFTSTEAYYKYLRNSQYTTLNNETVKSKLEKYIADFLFEHGIDYIYEKSYYPYRISLENARLSDAEIRDLSEFLQEKKEIIPDFYLPKHHIIWEHWAVTGEETKEEVVEFQRTVGNYDEYICNKSWKKKFWEAKWRNSLANNNKYNASVKSISTFLETSHKQLNYEKREDVERALYKILLAQGIKPQKLSNEELHEKAWKKCIDGFTKMMEQFINKLQQNYVDNVDKFIERAKTIQDEKKKMYYRLGYQVYCKYLSVLDGDCNAGEFANYNHFDYDFNQILYEASKRILNGDYDQQIKDIKWILIDEYQDFSRLFDVLIGAILKRNSSIKVFCVGDDWQAINRYAGSDLKYFKTFASRYQDTEQLSIRTNYRSGKHIVQFANRFMNKCDMPGERSIGRLEKQGVVEEMDVSKVYLDFSQGKENIYLKYLNEDEYKRFVKAKYLKACADIIKKHSSEKIMILNRSNLIVGKELDEFNNVLRKICEEFLTNEAYNDRVIIKTVHTAKGEESDVVILLGVNERTFPVFNPNNDLLEIFDQTAYDSIEDEQRLYYVALTRAKQSLYILYEGMNKSPYIMGK